MNTKNTQIASLEHELNNFSGTESYHRIAPNLVLTDGAKYLADKAQCYWLFDLIASVLYKFPTESFINVTLKKTDTKAVVTLDDGNNNILYTQKIEFTDFPLNVYALYVQDAGKFYVAMLKNEY